MLPRTPRSHSNNSWTGFSHVNLQFPLWLQDIHLFCSPLPTTLYHHQSPACCIALWLWLDNVLIWGSHSITWIPPPFPPHTALFSAPWAHVSLRTSALECSSSGQPLIVLLWEASYMQLPQDPPLTLNWNRPRFFSTSCFHHSSFHSLILSFPFHRSVGLVYLFICGLSPQ